MTDRLVQSQPMKRRDSNVSILSAMSSFGQLNLFKLHPFSFFQIKFLIRVRPEILKEQLNGGLFINVQAKDNI